jgi:hypothetical protein
MPEIVTSYVQERTGTEFSYVSQTNTQSLGNVILDTSVVHRLRARDVVFAANGLRPNATLYPFFDNVSVRSYVQQANVLQLDPVSASSYPVGTFYIGQVLYVKKTLTGNVNTTISSTTITGNGTEFDFELLAHQLVRIQSGVNVFDRYIASVASNTSATFTSNASSTLLNASLSTLTRVVIADVTPRVSNSGQTVTYTLKVVRAQQDVDADSILGPKRNYGSETGSVDNSTSRLILPEDDGTYAREFNYTAGGLAPQKMVKDAANTTYGATVILPMSSRVSGLFTSAGITVETKTLTVNTAIVTSGVVRSYGSNLLRLDNDITDAAVANGTTIYFVGGPGAGQSANITNYYAANQTAVVDTSTLTNITAGQTIYSIGNLVADGFLANSTVTAGGAGTVAGVLHLQEGQFATGTRLFRLTDSNTNDIASATTTAETNYVASGISATQQQQSVVSRDINVVRRGVHDSRYWENGTYTQCPTGWADPLAETFLVDSTRYPQGVMIASVDLVFSAKPIDDVPVIVELRPVVNGYPSSYQIVPCASPEGVASTSLRPDRVNVADTALSSAFSNNAVYTRFTFPALVHLLPGEYALVVRSDSSEYKVYIAELGGEVLGTDQKVAKQPYAGSFFKSQNGSTWTESPFEDLMFRLNKAKWTLSGGANTGILVARGVQPAETALLDAMTLFPYEVTFPQITSTSYSLSVKPEANNTAIAYTVAPNRLTALQTRSFLQGSYSNTAVPQFYPSFANAAPTGTTVGGVSANTIDAVVTLTTQSQHVAPYIDIKKMNVVGVKYLINDMGLDANVFVITNPGAGYANAAAATGTVTTSASSNVVTGSGTTFTSTLIVGRDVVIGGNLALRVASIDSDSQFTATTVAGETRSANAYATYANVTLIIGASDVGVNAVGYAVVSAANSSNVSGVVTDVVLTTNGSGYLTTPTISINASSFPASTPATIEYRGEDNAQNGHAETRYFTRQVTLAEGFAARDIKVYFDAMRPSGTNFYVYYKVLPGTADLSRFEDQPWRLMTQVTSNAVVSTRDTMYKEFQFITPENRAFASSTDTTDRFQVFAIKVVMATDNTTIVPRIRNFRAIALDE